jgi:GTP-binding protein Era
VSGRKKSPRPEQAGGPKPRREPPPPPPPTRAGRIALVGRPNVGKSTLLNALVGEHLAATSHHPQTTRDRIVGVLSEPEAELILVDTPGLHAPRTRLGTRMVREAEGAIEGADVLVFVTDVGREPRAEVHADDVALLAALPSRPLVIVINKVDRVADKPGLFPLLAAYDAARDNVAVVPLSARGKDGLAALVRVLREHLPQGERSFEEGELTDRPARFFAAEFVREQILDKTRAEVPHGVAVVVTRFDEGGKVVVIELEVVVDKPSHKKIVIGKGGAVLKAIGTDARKRIETMLERKVHLTLWVRVEPRWYDSDARLVDLGYGGGS